MIMLPAGPMPVIETLLRALNAPKALPPARSRGEYGEPWYMINGGIVTAEPMNWPDTIINRDAVEYYGGQLVCESMQSRYRDRAVECVNFCEGVQLPHGFKLRDVLDALALAHDTSWMLAPSTSQILERTGR